MSRAPTTSIADLLTTCNVMSLATWEADKTWASSVFFVADEEFTLCFVSSAASRHSQNLAANPNVAATVNKDHDDWLSIRGLQIEGRAAVADEAERDSALGAYLRKFPQIARLRTAPSSDEERVIADRLFASDFYLLKPRTIRVIDNSREFGFKMELTLGN